MKRFTKASLTSKLVVAFIVVGILPLVTLGLFSLRDITKMGNKLAESFQTAAHTTLEKIDRNLFERYGDVQAFAANSLLQDRANWYVPGSDKNRIADAMNTYVRLYGIYAITMAVDLEGKVIAVNDRTAAGKPLETAALYQKNYKDTTWFKECQAGQFLKSDLLDGTHVEDVSVDEDVKRATGSEGLVLGFSAPIRDPQGKTIGFWRNSADFALVGEMITDSYDEFKSEGYPSAQFTLIDRTGRVLIQHAPAQSGANTIKHDPQVTLRANLATAGNEIARKLTAGQSGTADFKSGEANEPHVVGYAVAHGALGFPGLQWGLMISIPSAEALPEIRSAVRDIILVGTISVGVLFGIAWWLGRSLSRPIVQGMVEMESVSEQVVSAATQIASASQSLAEGASEQAASLEETSASLEEMSSMARRNHENTEAVSRLTNETRDSATTGQGNVRQMSEAINGIQNATREMRTAIDEIVASSDEVSKIVKGIEEIAFQTNILALNAAVEAARAGEAGMGFAVVADEVRNLAHRSSTAARESAERIETSRRRSSAGVEVSERVARSLDDLVAKARTVEQSFQSIAAKTGQVDETAGQITLASREQTEGVTQINVAVSEMDKVTQANAAGAEECASAAEELNSQARTLQSTVQAIHALVTGNTRSVNVPTASAASPRRPAASRPASPAAKPARPAKPAAPSTAAPAATAASPAPTGATEFWNAGQAGADDSAFVLPENPRSQTSKPAAGDFRDF